MEYPRLNTVSRSAVRVFLDEETSWMRGLCEVSLFPQCPWSSVSLCRGARNSSFTSLFTAWALASFTSSYQQPGILAAFALGRFGLSYNPLLIGCWQHGVKAPPSLMQDLACHSLSLSLRLTEHCSMVKCARNLVCNQVQKDNRSRDDCLENDTFIGCSCQ